MICEVNFYLCYVHQLSSGIIYYLFVVSENCNLSNKIYVLSEVHFYSFYLNHVSFNGRKSGNEIVLFFFFGKIYHRMNSYIMNVCNLGEILTNVTNDDYYIRREEVWQTLPPTRSLFISIIILYCVL